METLRIIFITVCFISKIRCFQFVREIHLKECALLINQIANGLCFCDTSTPFECSCQSNGIKYTTIAPLAIIFAEKREQVLKWPPSEPYDARKWHPLLGSLTGHDEPLKHLRKYPQNVSVIGTKFYFFDDINTRQLIDYKRKETLAGLRQFDQLYVVIHGYFGSFESFFRMKDKLFQQNINSAVTLVDWSLSSHALYSTAAANTVIVGREVALLLYLLVKETRIRTENVHVIGHNLGAQVAHFAGQWFEHLMVNDIMERENTQCTYVPAIRLNRITGLDPSSTDFEGYQGSHISRYDAHFVDVIHTSAMSNKGSLSDILLGFSGMSQAVGDINFYPNGGKSQPGCQSNLRNVYNGLCSESKAVLYFEESLNQRSRHLLKSYSCNSWSNYFECRREGKSPSHLSRMGIDASDFCGKGKHYLLFKSKPMVEETNSIDQPENKGEDDASKSLATESSRLITITYVLNDLFQRLLRRCAGLVLGQPNPISRFEDYIEEPPEPTVFPGSGGSDIMFNHPSCGLSKFPPTKRIFNGFDAYTGQFPWTVLIKSIRMRDGLEGTCTGSIINKYWILTAAHCIKPERDWDQYIIVIFYGRANRAFTNMEINILQQQHHKELTFIHPLYHSCLKVDIALLKVGQDEAIKGLPKGREQYTGGNVNRICLKTLDVGDIGFINPLTVSGWGVTGMTFGGDKTYPSILQHNEFKLFPETICNLFRAPDTVKENTFCLSGTERNTSICEGDSGAPIAVKRRIGAQNQPVNAFRYHQVAVLVKGDDVTCGTLTQIHRNNKRYPVFNYGIKIKSIIDWIYETIETNSNTTIQSDM